MMKFAFDLTERILKYATIIVKPFYKYPAISCYWRNTNITKFSAVNKYRVIIVNIIKQKTCTFT